MWLLCERCWLCVAWDVRALCGLQAVKTGVVWAGCDRYVEDVQDCSIFIRALLSCDVRVTIRSVYYAERLRW